MPLIDEKLDLIQPAPHQLRDQANFPVEGDSFAHVVYSFLPSALKHQRLARVGVG